MSLPPKPITTGTGITKQNLRICESQTGQYKICIVLLKQNLTHVKIREIPLLPFPSAAVSDFS